MNRNPDIEARLSALPTVAMASMHCVHDDATVELEMRQGSDVAGVRGHTVAPGVAPPAVGGGAGSSSVNSADMAGGQHPFF